MAGLSDHTPHYLSPRSADVVLSEIRPTRLAPDALRSINVLLDELLWMILSMARSFATDQLKAALGKLLPTSLGKDALLEAEVELRAYWDRTTNVPSRPYAENADFPIQPAFELLRLKCEAYSTFNDADDDTDTEKRWQSKVTSSSGFATHNVQYIAPCALYLTAILEHVCEHVLSNTGRVASRDSSRSTATLQDLFLALCEDDAIYGLFKIMKVHSQIESQCNAPATRPGRSKSIHRTGSDTVKGSSPADGAPLGSVSTSNGDSATKSRVSTDSGGSGTAVATVQSPITRSSTEKSKAKKLFGRMSVDREAGPQSGHESGHMRSTSVASNGKRPSSAMDDPGSSPSEVEFDELMRSGTTMKVSLTPDRLRTFDVYNKDKNRGISKIVIPSPGTQQSPRKGPLQDSSVTNRGTDDAPLQTPKTASGQHHKPLGEEQDIKDTGAMEEPNGVRTHKQSKGAPPVSYEQPLHSRARSTSASQSSVTSMGNRHLNSRKGSLGALPVESIHSQSLRGAALPGQHSKMSASLSSNTYSGKRNHHAKSHDSIDDGLDGSSDEDGPVKKTTPRRGGPTVGVSAQTADLIDFLNSGPPDLPKAMSPTPTSSSLADNKAKRGRLRSIVSRLKGGQSTDKLSNQASFEDFASARKSPVNPHPPPSFVPPPLSAKRSLHSLSSYTQSQVSLPKPPAPPVPYVSIPLSPPLSPSHSFGEGASPARPRPSPTTLRKAVPAFTGSESIHENGNALLIASKPTDVSPPTPSKIEHEKPVVKTQHLMYSGEGKTLATNSSGTPTSATPTAPKPSESMQTPPPSYPSIHPPSKQTQRHHALSPPSTPEAFAANITDLRRLMANSTSADECRLLLDMFLAQSGLPIKDTDFPPDPKLQPSAQQESAVIEVLLGNGEPFQREEVGDSNGSTTREPVALPTPRPDERYTTTSTHRKPVPGAHTAQVVLAEA